MSYREEDPHAFPRGEFEYSGLTKRELFAAMALQGVLGSNLGDDQCPVKLDISADPKTYCKMMAESAVMYADALIAELAKVKS